MQHDRRWGRHAWDERQLDAPAAERQERQGGFPLREFLQNESASGFLLLACTLIALIWANSPWSQTYDALWSTELTLGTVHFHLTESLRDWVNDGLMAVFFFVIGLEIKRELLVGELASPRRAVLPVIAALGGVLVPAGIYLLLNRGTPGAPGWGIPIATDITFALGVLTLLGERIPLGLKVFVTALAIVDDLLAVPIIAVFYTIQVHWEALGAAAVVFATLIAANRLHLRKPLAYGLLGIALWTAVFESGMPATLAGVLLALTVPARTRIDPDAFVAKSRALLGEFDRAGEHGASILTNGAQQGALAELEDMVEGVGAPLPRLERALHAWVAFGIVPLFALANAGVRIDGNLGEAFANHVTLGVVFGLVLGKQIGVTLGAWLAVRSGLTDLPAGVTWGLVYGVSWLGGIGFTLSLFVADRAFGDPGEAHLLTAAKLGVLMASLLAGVGGWLVLRLMPITSAASSTTENLHRAPPRQRPGTGAPPVRAAGPPRRGRGEPPPGPQGL